eukprot:5674410-Pyramimonas_sp.AAC.1
MFVIPSLAEKRCVARVSRCPTHDRLFPVNSCLPSRRGAQFSQRAPGRRRVRQVTGGAAHWHRVALRPPAG